MARRVNVETVPAGLCDRGGVAGRVVDLSFSVTNDGDDELELVAIEEDVYGKGHGLLRRRRVDASTRIGPRERRTVGNPIGWVPLRNPLATLVYTLLFRTAAGDLPALAVTVSPTVPATRFGW